METTGCSAFQGESSQGLDVFDGVPAPGASKKMMKTKKKSGAKLP